MRVLLGLGQLFQRRENQQVLDASQVFARLVPYGQESVQELDPKTVDPELVLVLSAAG